MSCPYIQKQNSSIKKIHLHHYYNNTIFLLMNIYPKAKQLIHPRNTRSVCIYALEEVKYIYIYIYIFFNAQESLICNIDVVKCWGGSRMRSRWGLLILDKRYVEVTWIHAKKHERRPSQEYLDALGEGISNNYFESIPKKTSVSVTLNALKAKVFNWL